MKTAVIRHRVADFLKQHPPFDSLPEADLLALAGSGRVKFHEEGEQIYQKGGAPGAVLFVIQQGRVELLDESPAGERLTDVLGEGDLLGLDRLRGDGKHRHTARTASDVILYAIDGSLFASLVASHAEVERYVAAHVSVSASSGVARPSWLNAIVPPPEYLRARREAIGLEGASEISAPVTTRTAVRRMLATGKPALAVAPDGLLTADDLALFCGRNPLRLLERIRASRSAAELGPLLGCARHMVVDALGGTGDVDDGTMLGSAFIGAALDAAAGIAESELTAAGLDWPHPDFCWVAFGPAARGELLAPALPSLAVVYDDGECGAETAPWFAALAGQTIACLNESGLEGPGLFWPEGAQPCMPVSEWKRFYSETVRDPIACNIYARRQFFDVVCLSGSAAPARNLEAHIRGELENGSTALFMLANDTLSHLPPLTFFRGLVLQLDGAESDRFDLRQTVIDPIADAARAFALGRGAGEPGTLHRLSAAAAEHSAEAALFVEAAAAFRAGLYFEALAGQSRIDPAVLGRYDQRVIKTAFASIQRLLEFTIATFAS